MTEETKETKEVIPGSKKKKKKRKILLKISVVFLFLVLICWFAFGSKVMKLRSEAKKIVSESTENTFKASQTSIVYDTKGKQYMKLRGEKDAYYLKYKDIPVYVVASVISVEDRNFYKHSGVDYKGISRAAVTYVLKKGEITQGGSTITQQLAKTVFLNRKKTWQRKVKEIFIATELEKKYSKNQILEFYLNNVYYANGYYGIEAASRGYFHKDAKNLTMSEAAFLSAIPNNPTTYDPLTNKKNTIKRRNKILRDMYKEDLIQKEQYESALREDIKVKKTKKREKRDYVETYIIHCATKEIMKQKGFEFKYKFKSNKEKQEYNDDYEKMYAECKRTLYSAGYRIYTSIDPKAQKQLQQKVDNQLKNFTQKDKNGIYKTQAAATSIDNETGRVVAIVGGRKQKNIGYSLNRAYQSPRQPGSSIKPLLVFAPALEHGWSAGSIVSDTPMNAKDPHRVGNYAGSYSGQISLRRAVEKSSNVVTMRLYEQLGPKTALRYLEKMNFKYLTSWDYKYYTTCIGGFRYGATTEEMAAGYAALQNKGVYREPTCIKKMTTSDGEEIISTSPTKRTVYTKAGAAAMTDILKSNMISGTGRGAKVPNIDTAGKTGTTNDNRDGWFCGYTPYYTTAIWVGRDDNKIVDNLTGSSYPKSIWSAYMNAVHSEYSATAAPGSDKMTTESDGTGSVGTTSSGRRYYSTTASQGRSTYYSTRRSTYSTGTSTSSTRSTSATTERPATTESTHATTAAPTTAAPQQEHTQQNAQSSSRESE